MSRLDPTLPAELAALHPDPWTLPFWEATRAHRLMVQRCSDCGTHRMPPAAFCWVCQSQKVAWDDHSGDGTIYTFTVTHRTVLPILSEATPFAVAVVELAGLHEIRMVGNVIDADPEKLRIGQGVRVAWDDIDEWVTIPRFVIDGGRDDL
jgi:uncharacterized protein